MPHINPKAALGTVKVGRWTYPARRFENGLVERNTKTDGSGEFIVVEATRDAFAPTHPEADVAPTPAPAAKTPAPAARPTKAGSKAAKTAPRPKQQWVVGGRCPKGHKLTAESLYAMPSGRHQCRECRSAYRQANKKAASK